MAHAMLLATRTCVLLALFLGDAEDPAISHPAAQDPDRKDVLVLYGLQSYMPVVLDWERGIRAALQSGLDTPVRIETEYLDLLRSQDEEYGEQWMDLLRRKYRNSDPDVIIPVFDPGLAFVLDHRDVLFPNTPIVFCSAHFYRTSGLQLPPDVTGVTYNLGYNETLDLAKQLRPNTRKVVVVSGTSDYGGLMMAEARRAFAENSEFEFVYLTGLSIEELLDAVTDLSDDTIILFLVYVRDPQGRQHYANDVLAKVSARAPVPTFALWDTMLGAGAVGGHMLRIEQQGRLAGEMAVRVMHGEDPGSIPIAGHDTNQSLIDWRELRRWKIDESRLPADALVNYRGASFWQEYGTYILVAATIILLQSTLILGLLINRMKRLRAERALTRSREEARRLAGRIISAQEDERKRIARELHDDLSQRLAATAIEAGNLVRNLDETNSAHVAAANMHEELAALADDAHRISRQLHPSILDDLGLEDAIRSECTRISEREDIQVRFHSRDIPRSLPKTVALCIYRVAQEALQNARKHAAADRITVTVVADGEFLCLKVQDNGQGFEPAGIEARPGLGLASMKERVRLVEGKLMVDTQPGVGTTIEVCVPLEEDK